MKQRALSNQVHVAGYLTIKTFRDGELTRQTAPMPNKVVSSDGYGRNIITRQLAGDTTYSLEITSAKLGDGDTAAADADTDLGNALITAQPITNFTATNNVLTVDVFIADANLPDDTYAEFGLYCGTQLFARILIDPTYTKETGEDSLFTYTLTLSG